MTGQGSENASLIPRPEAHDAIEALDSADLMFGLVISGGYIWGSPMLPVVLGIDVEDERERVRGENLYLAEHVAPYRHRLVGACAIVVRDPGRDGGGHRAASADVRPERPARRAHMGGRPRTHRLLHRLAVLAARRGGQVTGPRCTSRPLAHPLANASVTTRLPRMNMRVRHPAARPIVGRSTSGCRSTADEKHETRSTTTVHSGHVPAHGLGHAGSCTERWGSDSGRDGSRRSADRRSQDRPGQHPLRRRAGPIRRQTAWTRSRRHGRA